MWCTRRGLGIGVVVTAMGASASLAGVASAAGPAVTRVLGANHAVSAPGNGHGHGGGTGLGWSSRNWSGYAVTGANGAYHGVTGTWVVPSVSRTKQNSYSAAWAGIDGFDNSSLIQTGTEQDWVNGSPQYGAWWTTSANGFVEQTIALPHSGQDPCSPDPNHNCGFVSPGDTITATITSGSPNWSITLSDAEQGWTFTKTTPYTGPGDSAEWIMEAPTVGGRIAPIANYASPDLFDPGLVNGNGNPGLVSSDGGVLVQGGKTVSIPSLPDSDTDGFNISYGSTQPQPSSS